MRSRAEIKQEAKEILRNANAKPWVVTLVWLGLCFALGVVGGLIGVPIMIVSDDVGAALLIYYAVIFAASFASMGLVAGYYMYLIGIRRGQEMPVSTLFTGYKKFWRFFGATFLVGLKTYLWSLLLVVPGIVAAYRYRFVLVRI